MLGMIVGPELLTTLPSARGDMRTDGAGSEDLLGEDDAIHQARGAQAAIDERDPRCRSWSVLVEPD
jgi:hypothetical protein